MSKKPRKEIIFEKALEILENRSKGIRYTELVQELKRILPDIPENTIIGNIWNLNEIKDEIAKPERGVFILKKFIKQEETESKYVKERIQTTEKSKPSEEFFYNLFAKYLVTDLEECTKAVPLGGNRFGDKWGTPDVFGVYKFSDTDPIKPQVEIISAEIKIDVNQLIAAFGQSCAYKLFSHKVYIVIPRDAESDIPRIESLCLRFGLGLILFNKDNAENPDFRIRTRAVKSEPDCFYVNKYLNKIRETLKELF